MSPASGRNSVRISPRQVPFSKLFARQFAFWIGAMYFQVS
jgi:hypothetical protein